MGKTIFKIDLNLNSDDPLVLNSEIVDKIKRVSGVEKVKSEVKAGQSCRSLKVHVVFKDSQEIQRVHKKIMTTLIKMEGVTVSGMSYDLNDMFG